jgi:ribose/xylose/arabinose/galactoside ABC-type transport system permease subunit
VACARASAYAAPLVGQRLLFILFAFLAGAVVGVILVLLDAPSLITAFAFLAVVAGIYWLGETRT